MFLISADVFCRLFFSKPFQGVGEIVSSVMIILCFLEVPYCLMKGTLVKSTVLYDKVNDKAKAIIDIVSCLMGIFVFSLIVKTGFKSLMDAIRINDADLVGSIRISTVPGRFSVVLGSVAMVIELVILTIKNIMKITSKDEPSDNT